jgi:hypothetical protein
MHDSSSLCIIITIINVVIFYYHRIVTATAFTDAALAKKFAVGGRCGSLL